MGIDRSKKIDIPQRFPPITALESCKPVVVPSLSLKAFDKSTKGKGNFTSQNINKDEKYRPTKISFLLQIVLTFLLNFLLLILTLPLGKQPLNICAFRAFYLNLFYHNLLIFYTYLSLILNIVKNYSLGTVFNKKILQIYV